MEQVPFQPEKDRGSHEKKTDKKETPFLRVPLPAAEFHRPAAPERPRDIFAGNLGRFARMEADRTLRKGEPAAEQKTDAKSEAPQKTEPPKPAETPAFVGHASVLPTAPKLEVQPTALKPPEPEKVEASHQKTTEVAASEQQKATAEVPEQPDHEAVAEHEPKPPEDLPMEIEEELARPEDEPGPLHDFIISGGKPVRQFRPAPAPSSTTRTTAQATPSQTGPTIHISHEPTEAQVPPPLAGGAGGNKPPIPPSIELPMPEPVEPEQPIGTTFLQEQQRSIDSIVAEERERAKLINPFVAPEAPGLGGINALPHTHDEEFARTRRMIHEAHRHGESEALAFAGLAYLASRHRSKKQLHKHEQAEGAEQAEQNERLAALEKQQAETRREEIRQYWERRGQEYAPSAATVQHAPNQVGEMPLGQRPEAQVQVHPSIPEQPQTPVTEQPMGTARAEMPQHHIEHSQWHAIEINDKTGKPVERPYGEAMRQERAPEQMVAMQSSNGQRQAVGGQQGAMGGAMLVGAVQLNADNGAHAATSQHGQVVQKEPTTRQQVLSNAKNPWFWAVIIFLIIVFFGVTLL